MNPPSPASAADRLTRRQMFRRAAGLAGTAALASATAPALRAEPAVKRGRIQHSIVQWCFEVAGDKWTLDQLCQVARELGVGSIELVAARDFPILRRHGLTCAIGTLDLAPDAPFVKGFNNPAWWPRVLQATTDAIDAAAAFGVPNVICFTGFSAKDPANPRSKHLSPEQGARNCVAGFKRIVGYAEQKGVTLCLEMLNSRDDTHPMKGHPGYQGDHTDYCIDILKRVSSPRLKLLFDVYHVQIMDGDVIRRLRQHAEYLGHVHVAGNPGRGELDDRQEIHFPPILRTLLEIGYRGYVGQEFIPTRDPRQGLREAITLCDV